MPTSSRMKRVAAGLLLASLGACGQGSTEPGQVPAELKSLPRPLSASEQQLINSGNDFAFSLFHQIGSATPGAKLIRLENGAVADPTGSLRNPPQPARGAS